MSESVVCSWCDEAPAVEQGYDEHNGPWALCAECKETAER